MPEKLKNIFFSRAFVKKLAQKIHSIHQEFDIAAFKDLVFDSDFDTRELKEKMYHITQCLHSCLPYDYSAALKILLRVAPAFSGFDAMLFPDFVQCYGREHRDLSLKALHEFTKYGSSEFAVRPFIADDPNATMPYLMKWASDPNEHVRRLASEGCRPRLPWAMALQGFKQDPTPILPVLEQLKNDDSEYVRRSVGNNLNDISKDNPEIVLAVCERWYGCSKGTDRIVKHACRDMLKSGNQRALRLFGFQNPVNLEVSRFRLSQNRLKIGQVLDFSFVLSVKGDSPSSVRLEYGIDYIKSRGNLSRKIFRIKEAVYNPGTVTIFKKHSFHDHSTRQHFSGTHHLAILINGVEKACQAFELT